MIIILPREVLSGNTLAYGHWRARMRDRDAWIGFLRRYSSHLPRAAGRRHVRLTAYRKRRLDEDNLSSGFKHGRDAMVRIGLLVDDNRAGCVFTYDDCHILSELPPELLARYGRKPLTVLVVTDIDSLKDSHE